MNYFRYWLPAEKRGSERVVYAAWYIDSVLTVIVCNRTADRAIDGDPSSGERPAIGCVDDGTGYPSAGLRVANG
jgi:hypothetical protein